jgi:hypothetical protein
MGVTNSARFLYLDKLKRSPVSLFLQYFLLKTTPLCILDSTPYKRCNLEVEGSGSVYMVRKYTTKSTPKFLDEGTIQRWYWHSQETRYGLLHFKGSFPQANQEQKQNIESETTDVLQLCFIIPLNVIEDGHLKPSKSLLFWLHMHRSKRTGDNWAAIWYRTQVPPLNKND